MPEKTGLHRLVFVSTSRGGTLPQPLHIQTHILSGWVAGNLLPGLSGRERAFCMMAAALPDIDGLGIILSEELYWDLHHKLGHNVFFFAILAALFAALSRRRLTVLLLCFALGWLHFVLDYFGSGPGWDLYPWWPISESAVRWERAWPFFSWQNLLAFGLVLAATIGIALKLGRTPIEWFMPRLDAQLVAVLRRVFRRRGAQTDKERL